MNRCSYCSQPCIVSASTDAPGAPENPVASAFAHCWTVGSLCRRRGMEGLFGVVGDVWSLEAPGAQAFSPGHWAVFEASLSLYPRTSTQDMCAA